MLALVAPGVRFPKTRAIYQRQSVLLDTAFLKDRQDMTRV